MEIIDRVVAARCGCCNSVLHYMLLKFVWLLVLLLHDQSVNVYGYRQAALPLRLVLNFLDSIDFRPTLEAVAEIATISVVIVGAIVGIVLRMSLTIHSKRAEQPIKNFTRTSPNACLSTSTCTTNMNSI